MTGLNYDGCAAAFDAETKRLGAMVTEVDPQMPVPTCPGWTVRDLVGHVGTGHRWSAGIIERRLTEPPSFVVESAPLEQAEWTGWLTAGARRLLDAVRAAGAEQTAWTWRPERTAGFWVRKMLHDEVVHRCDVELACDRLGAVAADVAVDGVSDWLASIATLSQPAGRHPTMSDLAGTGETLRFEATDADRPSEAVWTVERTPTGAAWRLGHAHTDVVLRAPARELLLILNRRLNLDSQNGVEITGDRGLLEHWLEHTRF